MSNPRRSTVHDLSALRLHPDGKRVSLPSSSSVKTNTNASRYAVKNSRGEWVVADAGGVGKVGKRVKRRKVHHEDEDAVTGKGKGKERADVESQDDEPVLKHGGAIRRREFTKDFGFLDGPVGAAPDVDTHLPNPSSDLLKCIHHFASTYYNEHGQLLNVTQEVRREKKARKLAKLNAAIGKRKRVAEVPGNDSHGEEAEGEGAEHKDADANSGEDDGQRSGSERDTDDGQADGAEEDGATEGERKSRSRRRPETYVRDMYKMLDGSAMMAVGMLLQEHVSSLVTPRVSEDWENQMEDLEEGEVAKGSDVGDDVEDKDEDSREDGVSETSGNESSSASQRTTESDLDSESEEEENHDSSYSPGALRHAVSQSKD
ncbi:hypothetical protein PLICRDRAFT_693033 [Plicaturopsis crispa FD-325 SS-3]|nr:hypothetical protein PLICRDRAFT_693033 [Plicaturopsis crispa FD-325 SS-3]